MARDVPGGFGIGSSVRLDEVSETGRTDEAI